jgi:formylglycine-generating enzyme required for sulfatase activity/CRP-like cAMP-binding protein
MPRTPDFDLVEKRVAALPLTKFHAGEVVLLAGSRSEQLLFLKKGMVAVVKDGIEIARVKESGAVLGELSVLLNQPHSADVRAVEASQFHVASADILARDPLVLLHVAAILARRLNATNRVFVELKSQLEAGQRGGIVEKTIEKMEGLLGGVLRVPAQSFEPGGGLVNRADTFLAAHPNAEHPLRRIFALKLANVREDEAPTRRRAPRSEFTEEEWRLVEKLADHPNGLLVTVTPEGGETYVEVAHEMIFRRWRKLRDWIGAEREFLAWKTWLEAARRGWQETPDNGKSDALLMGASLTEARSWRAKRGEALPAIDREFIDQSTKRESKVKARARHMRALVYLMLLGIIAGAVGWIGQSYLSRQWFRYTQVRPHVLSLAAERALKPGDTFRECADANDCLELVVVPAGGFTMGSPTDEEGRTISESPQHEVTIAAPFAVSKFEVTFDEWDTCATYGDCHPQILDSGFGRGSKPVINVSWYDARRYAAWLSKMTGKPYRLLSETEWEYAARAGAKTSYSWGDEIGRDKTNCLGCGSEWDGKRTAPVGSFAANAFGLHDMHGNVSEWVEDCHHANYHGAPADGSAWTAGGNCSSRILRGGGWDDSPVDLRSASRDSGTTFIQSDSLGFRVARSLAR